MKPNCHMPQNVRLSEWLSLTIATDQSLHSASPGTQPQGDGHAHSPPSLILLTAVVIRQSPCGVEHTGMTQRLHRSLISDSVLSSMAKSTTSRKEQRGAPDISRSHFSRIADLPAPFRTSCVTSFTVHALAPGNHTNWMQSKLSIIDKNLFSIFYSVHSNVNLRRNSTKEPSDFNLHSALEFTLQPLEQCGFLFSFASSSACEHPASSMSESVAYWLLRNDLLLPSISTSRFFLSCSVLDRDISHTTQGSW